MIGERLEEARKRKGVSIREAAEATKIRGDYLLSMEDNSFRIELPQIYVRGFLKNYARYLRLDPSKILTDYDAHLLGRSQPAVAHPRSTRESLGHMEIAPDQAEPDSDGEKASSVIVTEKPEDDGPEPELSFNLDRGTGQAEPVSPTLERAGSRYDQETWNENKALYIKIGIVFAGILLVSIILIVLVQLLTGKKETPAINPELSSTVESVPTPTPSTQVGPERFVITASDNVTLIIEQTVDRQRLYSGSLNAGETLSLTKTGPVSIRFTNGEALIIEKNGQQFRPGQSGVGRTVVE